MHADAHLLQAINRGGDVDGVAAEPVPFGDEQDVILLELIHESHETRALLDGELPETVSDTTRRGVTVNPAASISWIWFSVV